MRDTWLSINPLALTHNLAVLRQHMPQSNVLAMVKADAYGHGVSVVSQWLEGQVEAFGVALIDEALALRAQGIKSPINVLEGVFSATELAAARAANLSLVVHNAAQIALLQAAPEGPTLSIWLKVNTGMNRLGFRPAEALKAFHQLQALSLVKDIVLMTHFACADEPESALTDLQLSRFRVLQDVLASKQKHKLADSLANSAAILSCPAAQGLWMRPGIALYGSSPFADRSAAALNLQPVMTLRSRVISVHSVRAGESVGYGATWLAPHATQIAVVGIGYGDGYPRHAVSGTPVLVNGQCCALVGRVSMDMITVDIGDKLVQAGDEVVLWGDGLAADEVAAAAGTISYELFCRLTTRVRRVVLPVEPAPTPASEPVVVAALSQPAKQVHHDHWPGHGKGRL